MSAPPAQLTCTALPGLPMVEPGDDLASIIAAGLDAARIAAADGDMLVIAQKIVSKAEGRYVALAEVVPGERALELAKVTGRDPKVIEVVLSESRDVVKAAPGLLVVEHRLGFVMANAGIDQSNIAHEGGERVLLLPSDPDGASQKLRADLKAQTGASMGIVINDSWGRPFRMGVTGVAIGAAGIPSFLDMRGREDLFGRPLQATELAIADELAALGSLMMGQAAEGSPVVHLRGYKPPEGASVSASALLRPREMDRFR
jgi:coenzyme F420-0:L-glutamate ligase/coenzyme F420-1:gamma-L-glutamate ligase